MSHCNLRKVRAPRYPASRQSRNSPVMLTFPPSFLLLSRGHEKDFSSLSSLGESSASNLAFEVMNTQVNGAFTQGVGPDVGAYQQ